MTLHALGTAAISFTTGHHSYFWGCLLNMLYIPGKPRLVSSILFLKFFYCLAVPFCMQDLFPPTRDRIHTPLQWKCRVLTTGPPGKSLSLPLKKKKNKPFFAWNTAWHNASHISHSMQDSCYHFKSNSSKSWAGKWSVIQANMNYLWTGYFFFSISLLFFSADFFLI